MNRFADRILREYPVRRTAREKEHFRLYLMGALRELGYDPKLQLRDAPLRFGAPVANVVVGDPEAAKLILTAHYDTGVKALLPPLMMPTRPMTAFLYLALTPTLVLLGGLVASFALTFALNAPHVTLPLFLMLMLASLLYLRFGPSETRNVDDNTSGVVTLMETAAALTPRYRSEAAFVFLDGGFGGLSGAKGFRARYPSAKEKPVVDVNCVARGDELLILPNRTARWNGELLDAILDSFEGEGDKTVFLKTDGLVYYPSNNRAFRESVCICGCSHLKGFGRIISTRKAESIDEANSEILTDGLCKLIANYNK